jgi:hypothetical protein
MDLDGVILSVAAFQAEGRIWRAVRTYRMSSPQDPSRGGAAPRFGMTPGSGRVRWLFHASRVGECKGRDVSGGTEEAEDGLRAFRLRTLAKSTATSRSMSKAADRSVRSTPEGLHTKKSSTAKGLHSKSRCGPILLGRWTGEGARPHMSRLGAGKRRVSLEPDCTFEPSSADISAACKPNNSGSCLFANVCCTYISVLKTLLQEQFSNCRCVRAGTLFTP